jgi:hypothetical protein
MTTRHFVRFVPICVCVVTGNPFPMEDNLPTMPASRISPLTEREFARISHALAEPRRVQILKEIGEHDAPTPWGALYKSQTISPARCHCVPGNGRERSRSVV